MIIVKMGVDYGIDIIWGKPFSVQGINHGHRFVQPCFPVEFRRGHEFIKAGINQNMVAVAPDEEGPHR
ncbi:MAG: hypothetical protein A2521_04455 [Deltaproteobacteria bacterium RIFOXYD12_FULL_57_12]|nr:MAG: hypothetical protein A2521_04455 [Deltaproteobacteria bacterium RIFOXYD12_FULL_57_12]